MAPKKKPAAKKPAEKKEKPVEVPLEKAESQAETRQCSACSAFKEKDAFSGGQWKKAKDRRCKECIDAEESFLADAKAKIEEEKEKVKRERQAEEEKRAAERSKDPTGQKARERRAEIAIQRILAQSAELTLEELLESADLLSAEVSHVKDDAKAVLEVLQLNVHAIMMNRTTCERALHTEFVATLSDDALHGLACELDIDMSEIAGLSREEVVQKVRATAKDKTSTRLCDECNVVKPKSEYGQNQWKKTSGSRCKVCMKREEDERKYLEYYEFLYGRLPDEEEVYTSQECLYETLGVESTATDSEIKRAYRLKAVEWHPDKWAGKDGDARVEAEKTFKLVAEAYATLSDKEKRKEYDKQVAKKEKKKKAKAKAQGSSTPASPASPASPADASRSS